MFCHTPKHALRHPSAMKPTCATLLAQHPLPHNRRRHSLVPSWPRPGTWCGTAPARPRQGAPAACSTRTAGSTTQVWMVQRWRAHVFLATCKKEASICTLVSNPHATQSSASRARWWFWRSSFNGSWRGPGQRWCDVLYSVRLIARCSLCDGVSSRKIR